MLAIHVENLPDAAVLECRGRIVQSDSVFKLRDFVMAQSDPTVVLDLSEVKAISGGGVGMLAFLDRWADKHGIQLKLYSPSKAVVDGLRQNGSILHFDIASMNEMIGMVSRAESHYQMAA